MESWDSYDLVEIYCGEDRTRWPLPAPVIMIILNYASLVSRGRHHTYFVVWS